jgi:hypothetical protein
MSNTGLTKFAGRLSEDVTLGPHVQYLFTFTRLYPQPIDTKNLRTVLSHTTSLRRLCSIYSRRFMLSVGEQHEQRPFLDFPGLVTLANATGSTLVELSGQGIIRPSGPQSPTPLYNFTALQTLDWQSPAKFEFKPEDVDAGALAVLKNLTFASVNDTFLRLLECMESVCNLYHLQIDCL